MGMETAPSTRSTRSLAALTHQLLISLQTLGRCMAYSPRVVATNARHESDASVLRGLLRTQPCQLLRRALRLGSRRLGLGVGAHTLRRLLVARATVRGGRMLTPLVAPFVIAAAMASSGSHMPVAIVAAAAAITPSEVVLPALRRAVVAWPLVAVVLPRRVLAPLLSPIVSCVAATVVVPWPILAFAAVAGGRPKIITPHVAPLVVGIPARLVAPS
mmetsp:Transcript_901/g.1855  ORF Transcript_901/g.1855 Transcript_901/m.1855 type:complete len:216 (-) Transcript_901:856-1503(-)